MPTLLITGANRGLGLELTRQYAAAGWRCFATCRAPDTAAELQALVRDSAGLVSAHRLDVKDHAQVDRLAADLGDQPLDLLLNNAGIYGPRKMVLGQIDYAAWAEVFAVNTMAPLRLVERFVDRVARSEKRVIACMSSTMGSISGNTEGRHYLYRSSKAALNSVVRSLAIDLRPRGVTVVALHPGWVRTDMGGADADLAPAESVGALRRVLDRLVPADSGRFFNYDGSEVPW